MPDTEPSYPQAAQFIQDWFGQLGINVKSDVIDRERPVRHRCCRRKPATRYKAKFDMFIWAWGGSPDPNALLQIFKCDQIGSSSDSHLVQPRLRQAVRRAEPGADRRRSARSSSTRCRTCSTTRPPYHILYYDAEPRRLPDRHVRRLAEPAARHRRAALHLRRHRLQLPDGREGGPVTVAVERGTRPVRRVGGSSAAPAATASRHPGTQHRPPRRQAIRRSCRSSAWSWWSS